VRRIREDTRDGDELVDYMLGVFRAEGESTRSRVEAASWLADRGFGRPQQTTLVGTADEQATESPDAHLSDEELRAGGASCSTALQHLLPRPNSPHPPSAAMIERVPGRAGLSDADEVIAGKLRARRRGS
jgi:hypothetical protein